MPHAPSRPFGALGTPSAQRDDSSRRGIRRATTWTGCIFPRRRSPSAPCPEPAQDGTGGALDATPHFVQRQARVPQGQRPPATVLEQIGTSLQSGHTCFLLKGIVLHYLCRCQ